MNKAAILLVLSIFCSFAVSSEVSNGLVQKYDARYPGAEAHHIWAPVDGYGQDGVLSAVGVGSLIPQYIPAAGGGGYEFRYTLDPLNSANDTGGAINLGNTFIPDYDEDYTVEVWFRADGAPAENHQQTLWNTQSQSANGMRLFIRDWDGANNVFGFTLEARDNTGEKATWRRQSTSSSYQFGKWYQVAGVYHGVTGGKPQMELYMNGVDVSGSISMNDPVPSDPQFMGNCAALGCNYLNSTNYTALNNKMYFDGGIALVRIYNRALSSAEIADNFNHDKGWITDPAGGPYNPLSPPYAGPTPLSNEEKVNLTGFAVLANAWLTTDNEPFFDNRFDYDEDGVIDIDDLAVFAVNWLNPELPRIVLFNNDTTNAWTCRPAGSSPENIGNIFKETINETAGTGVNVHMVSPGLGWVPWWKSKILPMLQQYLWFLGVYEFLPNDVFCNYVYRNGDFIQDTIDRCRAGGLSPYISYRLNDGHHLDEILNPTTSTGKTLCQFYYDHPEYKLDPASYEWNGRVQNWAIPEVRDYKYNLIEEICENYDIDGLELDFLRHIYHFKLDGSISVAERKAIMTGFVERVRALLDRTSSPGRRRYLCVRVPCYVATLEQMGLDLPALVAAGVDMVNLSNYYHFKQMTDIAAIRAQIPNTDLYYELAYTGSLHSTVAQPGEESHILATEESLYTTAHLAYLDGVNGLSAFNFVYYRLYDNEPPLHVFNHLDDKDWIAAQPQHYIIGNTYGVPNETYRQLSKVFNVGSSYNFTMRMEPPTGGWTQNGKLRIFCEAAITGTTWTAKLNGVTLTANADVSEPYPHDYLAGSTGSANQYRAWTVPMSLVQQGNNTINIKLDSGSISPRLMFIDLAIQ